MFTSSPPSNKTDSNARFDGSRQTAARMVFSVAPCALGFVIVATSEQSIRSIMVGDDPEMLLSDLQNQFPHDVIEPGEPHRECLSKILEVMKNPAQASRLALDNRGMGFQTRVWDVLQKVPSGTTANYTFLAEHLCSRDLQAGNTDFGSADA